MLIRLLGADRVRAELGALAELARLCAHLPLALRIAAANLADHPTVAIASYVAELRDGDRLAALQVPDDPLTAVQAAFHLSYDKLRPEARHLFRLLSVHPGPEISLEVAASLIGLSLSQTGATLDLLIRSHLLYEPVAGGQDGLSRPHHDALKWPHPGHRERNVGLIWPRH